MIKIIDKGEYVEFRVKSIFKLLAMRSKVLVRKSNIKNVKIADKSLRPPLFKMPGTRVPGVVSIGTFLGKDRKEFWACVLRKSSIEIELENEEFTKIVMNSKNVDEDIRKIKPQFNQ